MFRVKDTILSEDIATAKFACDLPKCKGACCVVGDAGAPVSSKEMPVLNKAYRMLKDELQPEAKDLVEKEGLIKGSNSAGLELNCIDSGECVFVIYDDDNVAKCAIQKAYFEGRFSWEKPLSCHLFPVRLKNIAGFQYANFEYVSNICSPACDKGEKLGIYLSDFLEAPLTRRYGEEWYKEFKNACEDLRASE